MTFLLQRNPHGTVGELTDSQKNQYRNQGVPTLKEVLQVIM